MIEKPLFIPLASAYFEAFLAGKKREELRRYGPRWNERTCRIGRAVVLSKGYGKRHRLIGRVEGFKRQRGETFGSRHRASIQRIYNTLDLEIACIRISLTPESDRP